MNRFDLNDNRLAHLAQHVPCVVPREKWGTSIAGIGGDDAGPVTGAVIWIPEGLLVRADCTECGARYERAVALPDSKPVTRPYLEHAMDEHMEELSEEWLPRHQSECAEPNADLPPALLDLRDEYEQRAERLVAQGQLVPAEAVLLFKSEKRLRIPFQPAIEMRAEDRRESNLAIEKGKAGVRHFLSRSDEHLVGAVFVGESWASRPPFGEELPLPSEDPGREEGVIVQAFTRDFGRTRFHLIEREEEGAESGPGELVDCWPMKYGGGRFAAGLIAALAETGAPDDAGGSIVDRALDGIH